MTGAQTAQFVPDPALFDSAPPDLTPVAPELPSLLDETKPSPAAEPAETPDGPSPSGPGVDRQGGPVAAPSRAPISAAALATVGAAVSGPGDTTAPAPLRAVAMTRPAEAPTVPAIPSRVLAEMKPGAGTGWAAEVDRLDGHPAAPEPPSDAAVRASIPAAPGTLPNRVSPAPPGLTERRQPPPPETVVMSGFTEEPPKPAAPPAPKTPSRAIGIALLVVLAGVVGYFVWRSQQTTAIQPVGVRVLTPAPSAVYRWFPGHGEVTDYETRTLSFETSGRLTELLPPGPRSRRASCWASCRGRRRSRRCSRTTAPRVAFYEQLRESMRAAGNRPELRQAELRLAEKRRLVEETQAALARLTLRASEPGELVETLAKVGTMVAPRTPIARLKGRALHGSFALAERRRRGGRPPSVGSR